MEENRKEEATVRCKSDHTRGRWADLRPSAFLGAFSCDWTPGCVLGPPRLGLRATKRRQDEWKNSRDSYGRAMELGLSVNAHTCRWEPPGAWWPSAEHFLLREASGWTWAGLRGGGVELTCKSRMSEKRNFLQSCRPECCMGYPGWPCCSLCWRTFISACFSCSVWNVCLSVRSCCLCCSSCTITHTQTHTQLFHHDLLLNQ